MGSSKALSESLDLPYLQVEIIYTPKWHVGAPVLYPIKREEEEEEITDKLSVQGKKNNNSFPCFNVCGAFPTSYSCSTSQVSYNLIWFWHNVSFWMYCQVPQFKGPVPGDCHWLHMSISGSRSLDYPQLLYDLAINQKFQKTASSGLMCLLEKL